MFLKKIIQHFWLQEEDESIDNRDILLSLHETLSGLATNLEAAFASSGR